MEIPGSGNGLDLVQGAQMGAERARLGALADGAAARQRPRGPGEGGPRVRGRLPQPADAGHAPHRARERALQLPGRHQALPADARPGDRQGHGHRRFGHGHRRPDRAAVRPQRGGAGSRAGNGRRSASRPARRRPRRCGRGRRRWDRRRRRRRRARPATGRWRRPRPGSIPWPACAGWRDRTASRPPTPWPATRPTSPAPPAPRPCPRPCCWRWSWRSRAGMRTRARPRAPRA